MNKITLSWQESDKEYSRIIYLNDPNNKKPGVIRIGRDPSMCDILLQCPRVSRLHAEIHQEPEKDSFKIQNLRESNPIIVNGKKLTNGFLDLPDRSIFILGDVKIELNKTNDETILRRQRLKQTSPASHTGEISSDSSITFSQFIPLASSEDLRSKGYLVPGIVTVVWVILLF